MKTTKELKIWSLRMVLFTILLSGLSVQKVYSFCKSTEIPMNGKWEIDQAKINTRSLPSIPITAYTDSQNICIENTSPDCDIQITITGNQTGEVMYEQSVPQAQTSYIIISIASFPSGEYTLELTSEDGKYLIGTFKR
jgi:hypothetical protein